MDFGATTTTIKPTKEPNAEIQHIVLLLLNEVRLNINDLNIHAARTNLSKACEIATKEKTTYFDEKILAAEGMCTALEFQQLAPPADRIRFRNLTEVIGKKLKFAI